ncbi:LysM peptidoglycan-binding domain-containing protein [Microbacterium terricola]|nr:LysM peptidoglycan-binding domain-containing protein [Microbacterium terricola]UYK40715.1 LysM peptidoglycan-binding domain-containing protein [Microbacterium terricola]
MSGLEKATLTNTVTGRRVSVQFNPEEYSIDRESTFAQLAVPGLSAPVVQFVNGNAQTVQLDLLVDTTEASPAGAAGADVRRLVGDITALMDIDPDLHAPPPAIFAWGQFTFTCVVQKVSQTFVLFRADGTPLRARLKVTLSEYRNIELEAKEIKRQTVDYTKTHVVAQGDTLALLAQREYADPTAWRAIAVRNGITDPRTLPVGITLSIPRLPYTDARGVVHVAQPAREAS